MMPASSLTQQGWFARPIPVVHCLGVGSSQTWMGGCCLPRVLVVDDCKDTADSLQMLVEMWGYDVEVAYDGETAIGTALDYHPDVIFLDLVMPKMHGCQVAQRLRRAAGFEDALIVAVSGRHDELHRKQAMEAGCDLYLVKPMAPGVMEGLLRKVAGRSARRTPKS